MMSEWSVASQLVKPTHFLMWAAV